MRGVVEILFWTCFFIIFYTYAGYPLLVFLLIKIKKIFRKPTYFLQSECIPVTMIIAAYNEEKIIEKKIQNCLSLDYPAGMLKLIFITDGSSDGTDTIIKGHAGITLLHEPERRGKQAAVNRAMVHVNTPVVIFTDANTLLNKRSVRYLMSHYTDPAVGGVAGEKRILQDNLPVGKGEGWYWRYESLLKRLDSSLETTVGAAGELFSVRTALYTVLPENTIIEDFVQSLMVCLKGYSVRYEPRAFSEESASLSIRDEMERKIRISAGAFQAMGLLRGLFNIPRHPVVSFQFISHRILRWTLCPLSLVLLFACSVALYFLTRGPWYGTAMIAQVIVYVSAAAGWWFARQNRRAKVVYLPFYFVFMNFCVFAGLARFLNGKHSVLWQKAERPG